jgi:ribosome-binding protein aMBF1 (putative translation factor)
MKTDWERLLNAERRKALEAQGYKVYDHAGDAVGMTEEEKYLMDLRISLSKLIRDRRQKLGLSQKALATRLGTSQPRVAKIEWGDWDVSLDQIFRAYAVMGGRLILKDAGNVAGAKVKNRKIVKGAAKKKLKIAQ